MNMRDSRDWRNDSSYTHDNTDIHVHQRALIIIDAYTNVHWCTLMYTDQFPILYIPTPMYTPV